MTCFGFSFALCRMAFCLDCTTMLIGRIRRPASSHNYRSLTDSTATFTCFRMSGFQTGIGLSFLLRAEAICALRSAARRAGVMLCAAITRKPFSPCPFCLPKAAYLSYSRTYSSFQCASLTAEQHANEHHDDTQKDCHCSLELEFKPNCLLS